MKNRGRVSAWWVRASLLALVVEWGAGCGGAAQQAAPQQEQALNSFQLSLCKSLNPGLYQCPGSDKPVCDPDYTPGNNPVDCVKVDRDGKVIVQSAVGP